MNEGAGKGHLHFGGWDVTKLAERFGTPLYVLSEDMIRERCGAVRSSFMERHEDAFAVYAGKAFLTLAMCRIIQSEGLGLDLVSGGEIFTALRAGFPMERTYFHGNSKTEEELILAIESGVGRIVVDGWSELETLERAAEGLGKKTPILLRMAPGVDAHTHRYILTGHTGSKFGFPMIGDSLKNAVLRAMDSRWLDIKGFHFHIGSQIFESTPHVMAVDIIVRTLVEFSRDLGFTAAEVNLGGGFGVDVATGEKSPEIASFTNPMMERLSAGCRGGGIRCPRVTIEPGRWIVSDAGITLYRVQTVKPIENMVTYVGVDGGMTDNPRPSLYGAKYRAVAADRMDQEATEVVTVVGKCCESGDVLVEGMRTPPLECGDLVAVLSTGAYNFSMASNYNRIPRPAVVLVSEGRADIIVERQSYEDLLRGEIVPDHLNARCTGGGAPERTGP